MVACYTWYTKSFSKTPKYSLDSFYEAFHFSVSYSMIYGQILKSRNKPKEEKYIFCTHFHVSEEVTLWNGIYGIMGLSKEIKWCKCTNKSSKVCSSASKIDGKRSKLFHFFHTQSPVCNIYINQSIIHHFLFLEHLETMF